MIKYRDTSAIEKGLYIESLKDDTGIVYNISLCFEINGKLDRELFWGSFSKLVDRHENLRTAYEVKNGVLQAYIHDEIKIKKQFEFIEVKNVSDLIRNFTTVIDISVAPLFNVKLVELNSEKFLFLMNVHHLIFDGFSTSILLRELVSLYDNKKLDDIKFTYNDCIAINESFKNSQDYENVKQQIKAFYREEFSQLELNYDKARKSQINNSGGVYDFFLEQELVNKVSQTSKYLNVSFYTVLLSAYHILLSRYTRSKNIVCGVPLSGRNLKEFQNIVGMFVNTLPIQSFPENEIKIIDYIKSMSENLNFLKSNQDCTLTDIIDFLNIKSEPNHSAIFDTVFNLVRQEQYLSESFNIQLHDNCSLDPLNTSSYDLSFQIIRKSHQKNFLHIFIEYKTDLFEINTIKRISDSFITILTEICNKSDLYLKDISAVSKNEIQLITNEFNNTSKFIDYSKTVLDIVSYISTLYPDKIALVFQEKSYTYAQLENITNQIAINLEEEFINPNDIVAILLKPSEFTVLGTLGIQKTGAAYMPMTPDYPIDRMEYMLHDSACKVLLTTQSDCPDELISSFSGKIIYLDQLEYDKTVHFKSKAKSENYAYVIYTSGSTGKPKGVVINHKALLNFTDWCISKYNMNDSDRMAKFSSFGFDASIEEVYPTLCVGAGLYVIPEEMQLDIEKLITYYNEQKITLTSLPTQYFEHFSKYDIPSIKIVIIGGEKYKIHVEKTYEVHNTYGPTEATVEATNFVVDKNYINIPIGKPLQNYRVYILDDSLNLCPIGVSGELCIAGDGIAVGYLNRNDLTKEKFVFHEKLNERIYRSGDLARWLPDGNIEFIGRTDFQVKIRGFRIELEEIEARLIALSSIKDVVILALDDEYGNKYLCAYYVSAEQIDKQIIKNELIKYLPDYMIPGIYVRMDKFPLTSNGKVNRKGLPKPDLSEMKVEYVAPRNKKEKSVCNVFAEVLGIDKVGINDNFFDLGGSSLKAVSLASKLQQKYDIKITDIFQNPTAELLSTVLKNKVNETAPITAAPKREYYAASASQRGMYLTDKMGELGTTYNIPIIFEVNLELDRNKFESAIDKLVQRHEIFRTNFDIIDGEVVQLIHDEIILKKDYEIITKSELKKTILEFVQPFDLSKAPLFRAMLIKIKSGNFIVALDFHHIIFDGGSIEPLMDDFWNFYEDKKVSPLSIQYKDYAEWEKTFKASDIYKSEERYWLEKLSGELPLLEFPFDKQDKHESSYAGSIHYFHVDNEIYLNLIKIAKRENTTLNSILLSAYLFLLSKYSRQDDIIIGTPISGRSRNEVQNMLGMFVNMLPFRASIDSEKTFKEFNDEVKNEILDMISNQDYSFAEIIETLRVKTKKSRNPLFDTVFNYLEETDNEKIKYINIDSSNAKFELNLTILKHNKNLTGSIEFKTSLFEPSTIQRFIDSYLMILKQVSATSDVLLKKISIISEYEKNIILSKFNNTEAYYPKDKTITEIFDESVKKYKNNLAIIYKNEKLTYGELSNKVNILAIYLKRNAVKNEDKVGILLPRGVNVILSQLAVLKAGCCYVPIDSEYPKERIEFMLKDSGAVNLISTKKIISKIGYKGIYLDISLFEFVDNKNEFNQFEDVLPTNLACLIYTSGSTGTPKGVMLEHKNLINFSWWYKNKRDLQVCENIALHSSFSFDAAIMGTYPSLFSGCTIHIIPEEIRLSLLDLDNYFISNDIKGCFFTTQLGEQYMENFDNKTLRFVEVGGEKLKHFVPRSYSFINGYGPTESTVYVTDFHVSNGYNNIPIGKPLSNVKIYISDNNSKLCPIGVSGELCISGYNLGRGYYNRTDLTNEKFIMNPFSTDLEKNNGYDRLYRTGDLARWLPDGNIEIIGRIDRQVKIRGFRIELGEIEARLVEVEGISDAIVLALDDVNGNKYLCGYYISDSEIDKEQLKIVLLKTLPDYMIPGIYVRMDKFPLTSNGKVNRKGLPKPDLSEMKVEYVAPRNKKEKSVCNVFAEVLGIDKVGINDNFFDLGGSSLKAVSLASKLQQKYEIKITDIFKNPTAELLSAVLKNKVNETAPITAAPKREYYAASASQRGMYLTDKMGELGTTYNIPIILDINQDINRELLGSAIDKLVQRHESLRTSFDILDGKVIQKIHDTIEYKKEYSNIRETELQGVITDFIQPFNLHKAPLFRVKLLKLKKDKYVLLFDLHHIIFDGGSVATLINDLFAFYEGKEPSKLEIQYKDYAEWEVEYRKNSEYRKRLSCFADAMIGTLSPLELPIINERNRTDTYVGNNYDFSLNSDIKIGLEKIKSDNNSTLFSVMFTLFFILLNKYSNQDNLIVGTALSGRNKIEIENTIGMFVNLLPVQIFIDESMTFKELLALINKKIINILDNQDLSFADIIDSIGTKKRIGRHPLFDIGFNYNASCEGDTKYKILDLEQNTTSKFDLTLNVLENKNNLNCSFEYKTNLFNFSSIEKLAMHFKNIVQSVLLDSKMKIAQIEFITREEREQILQEFNSTVVKFNKDLNIVSVFNSVVKKHPLETAIIHRDVRYTYNELNLRANQLAWRLIESGISSGDIIGIIIDQCPEMIIAILGVIKAGAAYIPIAIDYPEDRINFMLSDSNSKMILSKKSILNKYNGINLKSFCLCDENSYSRCLENPDINIKENDLAYIIYTSGSTGKPKGVLIEHKGVVALSYYAKAKFELSTKDIVSKYAGVGFDASIIEIFPTILSGAALNIIPEELKLDLIELNQYYKDSKISISFLPTQIGEMFMELDSPKSLRVIFVGGDKLKKFIKKDYMLLNSYGPTEATVHITDFEVDKFYDNIPIGKPAFNNKIYIVDKNMNLCPIGVPGELCVSNLGIARGYLNQPDLTESKFIFNLFASEDEINYGFNKLYKTGDLARWLPDGNIEFLGRIDFQVKIRGYRIELGEIETHFIKIFNIKDAVVLALDDESGNKYLCGYYTAFEKIDKELIKNELLKYLPEYMIPAIFIHMNEFPITPNGKVNRKILPVPNFEVTSEIEYVAPRNNKEKVLVDLFSEITGFKKVGINDNFFDLGGSSLKAVSLVAKLQGKGFNIKVSDLFDCPTIEKIIQSHSSDEFDIKQKFETIKHEVLAQTQNPLMDKYRKLIDESREKYINFIKRNYSLKDYKSTLPINNILLTGGTGYLGSHILYELLSNTNYTVYCIIRGDDNTTARERLDSQLKNYFGLDKIKKFEKRYNVLCGDLSSEHFSLNEEDYQMLIKNIDSIIHSAANVSHYGEYEVFYNANVKPVINLIEFASLEKKKNFHYISTKSVCDAVTDKDKELMILNENSDLSNLDIMNSVYIKTKLEGELVTSNARERGINTTIHRVGNLVFNSETGKHQKNIEDNAFYQTLKTYINIGYISELIDYAEMSYINDTARAICKLFDKKELQNEIFHVYNPYLVNLSEKLLDRSLDLSIDKVSFEKFIELLKENYGSKAYGKFIENLMLHLGWMDDSEKISEKVVWADKTKFILEKLEFNWGSITPQIFEGTIEHALKERKDFFNKVEFLSNNNETIKILTRKSKLAEIKSDEFMIVEGNKNEYVFFITEGLLNETKKSFGGWESTLRIIGAGNAVGIGTLFTDANEGVTFEPIMKNVVCYKIEKKIFENLVENNSNILRNIIILKNKEELKLKRLITALG